MHENDVMKLFNRQTKQETVIYTIVWVILFLSPLVSLVFGHDDASKDTVWIKRSLLDSYGSLLVFFIVFLIRHIIPKYPRNQTKTFFVYCT